MYMGQQTLENGQLSDTYDWSELSHASNALRSAGWAYGLHARFTGLNMAPLSVLPSFGTCDDD